MLDSLPVFWLRISPERSTRSRLLIPTSPEADLAIMAVGPQEGHRPKTFEPISTRIPRPHGPWTTPLHGAAPSSFGFDNCRPAEPLHARSRSLSYSGRRNTGAPLTNGCMSSGCVAPL